MLVTNENTICYNDTSQQGNTFVFNNENRQNEGTRASRCRPARLAMQKPTCAPRNQQEQFSQLQGYCTQSR